MGETLIEGRSWTVDLELEPEVVTDGIVISFKDHGQARNRLNWCQLQRSPAKQLNCHVVLILIRLLISQLSYCHILV